MRLKLTIHCWQWRQILWWPAGNGSSVKAPCAEKLPGREGKKKKLTKKGQLDITRCLNRSHLNPIAAMVFVTVECCKYHKMCTNSSQTIINSYRYINKWGWEVLETCVCVLEGALGVWLTMWGTNCSVQSSPAVSRLNIDSVDVVQSTKQLLSLQ